ncbi:MAG TPA: ATP-binding protein [Jiangellaceae bacterium]|nr:ATP-binding protein [Jiangellaceae bacterium]
MDGEYAVEGVALPDTLEQLHLLIARVAVDHPEVGAEDLSMLETAVIEIAGNLIEHGRPPGEVRYTFTLRVHPDRLIAVLSDSGEALPVSLSQPSMPDELTEDGRGLFLAHAVLDTLDYARPVEANTWEMTRLRR